MPMIALKDGTYISADHVVQYTKLRNGETRFLLSTGGEQCAETYAEDIAELFIPVIPANPGFVAVFAERRGVGSFSYTHRWVIAWRICPSGNYPLFEGYANDETYEVIIDPAGGVFDADGNMFGSLDEWRREYEAEASDIVARAHAPATQMAAAA
jgi:hypothetical protein